jgi:multiple antibiotic resistance protein
MDLASAIVTLLLVMDPLGNVPVFLSVLKTVRPERRRRVLAREVALAYVVLVASVMVGNTLLRMLRLTEETISVAGGIVLFLIAIRMVFPGAREGGGELPEGEPFIVPLAVPLIAGPSTLATLLLLQRSAPGHTGVLLAALTVAWALSGAILLSATFLHRLLGERGLMALERLMGMLLVMIAVQMFLNGLKSFLAR